MGGGVMLTEITVFEDGNPMQKGMMKEQDESVKTLRRVLW
jgi:hypothetical protein